MYCRILVLMLFLAGPLHMGLAQGPSKEKQPTPTDKAARVPLDEIRFRHDGKMVIAALFTLDGKNVATAGWDNLIRLWDIKSGQELRQFQGHSQAVITIAMHPDGKLLASGSNDKTITLWDIASGRGVMRLQGHTAGVGRVVFSPDGKLLASGGYDNSIRLWDVATGKEMITCAGHQSTIYGLEFGPDGKTLASASSEGTFRLWEVPTAKEIKQFGDRKLGSNTLAYSPDGKTIATAESAIRLWEVSTGKERWTAGFPIGADGQGHFWSVIFSPDGKTLASSSPDGTIRLWETATGKERRLVGKHDGGVAKVAFSPNGKLLVSASHDKTGRLWDLSKVPDSPARKEKLKPEDLASLWSNLAESDAARAYQAITAFEAAPQLTLPFLKKEIKPMERKTMKADGDQIARLIADLDADDFATREKASEELGKLGSLAATALHKALEGAVSAEAKRRIDALLGSLQGPTMSSEDLRLIRAIEILETIGSPDAQQLLKSLANGKPEAPVTYEASQALARLNKRSTRPQSGD